MDGSGRAESEGVERIRLSPGRLAGPLGPASPEPFLLNLVKV